MEEDKFRDDKGRLLPGHKGLKPKGANNLLQSEIKNKITEFLAGKIEGIETIYSEVGPKEKLKFIAELLAYVLPKSKDLKIESYSEAKDFDLSQLSDEELRQLAAIQDKIFKTNANF